MSMVGGGTALPLGFRRVWATCTGRASPGHSRRLRTTAGCVMMGARSAGLPFDLLTCLGLLAWFNFAMALPISLGGLGLQEALVLRLGLPLGIPAASLLAFSALLHLMRAALAVTGGIVSAASRNREARPALLP